MHTLFPPRFPPPCRRRGPTSPRMLYALRAPSGHPIRLTREGINGLEVPKVLSKRHTSKNNDHISTLFCEQQEAAAAAAPLQRGGSV